VSKHNFKASLNKGNLGEAELLTLFSAMTKLDGRHGDLQLGSYKVELKTDYYLHKPGGNFFMERYSDVNVGSPGGPWQARVHGCKYFVYYFINSGVGYVWNVEGLVTALDALIGTLQPVEVKNVRWVTVGFKVPRTSLPAQFSFSVKNKVAVFTCGDQALYDNFVAGGFNEPK